MKTSKHYATGKGGVKPFVLSSLAWVNVNVTNPGNKQGRARWNIIPSTPVTEEKGEYIQSNCQRGKCDFSYTFLFCNKQLFLKKWFWQFLIFGALNGP